MRRINGINRRIILLLGECAQNPQPIINFRGRFIGPLIPQHHYRCGGRMDLILVPGRGPHLFLQLGVGDHHIMGMLQIIRRGRQPRQREYLLQLGLGNSHSLLEIHRRSPGLHNLKQFAHVHPTFLQHHY
ncbi:hypothetical protein D3C76_1431010 [compost metagenome]